MFTYRLEGDVLVVEEWLYRYESVRYGHYNEFTDTYSAGKAQLHLLEYKVTAYTPKGKWISAWHSDGKDHWVSNTARKRFAYPTKEEAMEGYRQRKLAYVRHAKAALRKAEEDLSLTEGEVKWVKTG